MVGDTKKWELLCRAMEKFLLRHTALQFSSLEQNFSSPVNRVSCSDINSVTRLKSNGRRHDNFDVRCFWDCHLAFFPTLLVWAISED